MNQIPPNSLLPDTNILIHYTRDSLLYQWIEANYPLAPDDPEPVLSVVTLGEILSLEKQFGWGDAKHQKIATFIRRCRVIPLDYPGIVEAYATLDFYSIRKGKAIGDNDLWIAATAQAIGATLLTTDKDFDHLSPVYIQRDWIDPHLAR